MVSNKVKGFPREAAWKQPYDITTLWRSWKAEERRADALTCLPLRAPVPRSFPPLRCSRARGEITGGLLSVPEAQQGFGSVTSAAAAHTSTHARCYLYLPANGARSLTNCSIDQRGRLYAPIRCLDGRPGSLSAALAALDVWEVKVRLLVSIRIHKGAAGQETIYSCAL